MSTMPPKYRKNIVYVFLPFLMNAPFDSVTHHLNENSEVLPPVKEPVYYLFNYVAGKMDSSSEHCRCYRSHIAEPLLTKAGFKGSNQIYRASSANIYLQILDVQLYCFSTSVGILSYKLHFLKDARGTEPVTDPIELSEALFHLKRASTEFLCPADMTQSKSSLARFSFVSLADRILSEILDCKFTIFFQYLGASDNKSRSDSSVFRPRANFLIYLDVPAKTDTCSVLEENKKELYYLRHCYNKTYFYEETLDALQSETLQNSHGICWAFTTEATVCLTCQEKEGANSTFIQRVFFQNFNFQYLPMYLFLLHQKYAIYMFLTKIDTGISGIEALEAYQKDVHSFEMDFMYSHISEVPQYQMLYEKLHQTFALNDMYTDVLEPLQSLSEDRRLEDERLREEEEEHRRKYEEEQQKSDAKMNRALSILSVLSITSAMVDGYDLIDSIAGGDFGAGILVLKTIQYLFLIIIVSIWMAQIGIPQAKKFWHRFSNKAKTLFLGFACRKGKKN